MTYELPYYLTVDGVDYPINWDYRDAFDALESYNAKDLSTFNKQLAVLEIIYGDNIPSNTDEALKQAIWFLDGGDTKHNDVPPPKTMDYTQDAPMLFSAVNRIAGREIRDPDIDLHWFTFLGLCNEIDPDSPITHIVHIRTLLAEGKKLEKNEREFYNKNKHLVDFASAENDYETLIQALRE